MTKFKPFNRRVFLSLSGGAVLCGLPAHGQSVSNLFFSDYPFQLGVAAGDPSQDGFVIWTRLAPKPLEPGHGMAPVTVRVRYEVAEDQGFSKILTKGEALARPELGHSVHAEIVGLAAGKPYFYRFFAGSERSPVGRAKTLPSTATALSQVRFAVGGCQHYEQGYYSAWRHVSREDLDFVFCYGDYIYEGRSQRLFNYNGVTSEAPRQHQGGELYSITDYRTRYAQYKMDPDLQDAHASAAWFSVWDDHEIDNNWVMSQDQDGNSPEIFELRRAMAMQAFYENTPLRARSFPRLGQTQLFRRAQFGDLLDMHFLDTRQYRTDQPCNDRWRVVCDTLENPEADILGKAQEEWLLSGLSASKTKWQSLAQQIMIMDLDREPGPTYAANLDTWAGYRVPRQRLIDHIHNQKIKNLVVLTGDEHQNYAGEIHSNGREPKGAPAAVEFVATSISSGGDGQDVRNDMAFVKDANPNLKFNNAQRGYVLCTVTPKLWRTDFKVMDQVTTRGGTLSTRASFGVVAGEAGLKTL